MKLYEEVLLLQHFHKGGFVVENVIPYYEPLIAAHRRGRHLYWTNFNLPMDIGERECKNFIKANVSDLSKFHDYDFTKYKGEQRMDKMARNLVDYEVGKTILEAFLGLELSNITQPDLL